MRTLEKRARSLYDGEKMTGGVDTVCGVHQNCTLRQIIYFFSGASFYAVPNSGKESTGKCDTCTRRPSRFLSVCVAGIIMPKPPPPRPRARFCFIMPFPVQLHPRAPRTRPHKGAKGEGRCLAPRRQRCDRVYYRKRRTDRPEGLHRHDGPDPGPGARRGVGQPA